jgi:hypothetical protein
MNLGIVNLCDEIGSTEQQKDAPLRFVVMADSRGSDTGINTKVIEKGAGGSCIPRISSRDLLAVGTPDDNKINPFTRSGYIIANLIPAAPPAEVVMINACLIPSSSSNATNAFD